MKCLPPPHGRTAARPSTTPGSYERYTLRAFQNGVGGHWRWCVAPARTRPVFGQLREMALYMYMYVLFLTFDPEAEVSIVPFPVFGRGWGTAGLPPQGSSDSKRHGFGMPSRCTPAWAVSRSRRCTVGPNQRFIRNRPFPIQMLPLPRTPGADFSINADSGSPRPSRPILSNEVMFLACILDI